MAVGTAGFTAMLAIMALEDHGLSPEKGPVLVTGAAGGVGSVATAILAGLGYEVAAVTGRPEQEAYLQAAWAPRRSCRATSWPRRQAAAGIRDLGGLRRCGGRRDAGPRAGADEIRLFGRGGRAAGGAALPATVIPFLLRGVNLLGIDSVMQPYENRLRAWDGSAGSADGQARGDDPARRAGRSAGAWA
jgi:acrylyl-CoA reductase (NADPH)